MVVFYLVKRRSNTGAIILFILTFTLSVEILKNIMNLLILIPLVILHIFTVNELYDKALARRLSKKDLVLIAINGLPYILLTNWSIIIPALIFAMGIITSYARIQIIPQILGTIGISSFLLPWYLILNKNINFIITNIYLYWIIYTYVEAIYVEYKLPYRKIGYEVVVISWSIGLFGLIFLTFLSKTYILLSSLIEPSLRFFNPGNKLSTSREIRDLGMRGLKRLLLYFSILLISEILYSLNTVKII
jgi:hypothetical protein